MLNSTAAAAAKRKGSFKKWLRSSHRKFTSSTSNANRMNGSFKEIANINSTKLTLSSNTDLIENMKIKVNQMDTFTYVLRIGVIFDHLSRYQKFTFFSLHYILI
jgi:hypothetical protein